VRILFDECVPRRLKRFLPNHIVTTVPEAGWSGIKNGELLKLATGKFDVFLTVDRNLSFQQNLTGLPLPIIVIHSASNKLADLEKFVQGLAELLTTSLPSKVLHLGP